jgi:hypothetical protein
VHIAFGKDCKDNTPRQREMTFEQFIAVARARIHHGRLSFAEYAVAGKLERGVEKDAPWFIPALFVRAERRSDAVGTLSGFVCDFDDGAISRTKIEAALAGVKYAAWTSYSHGISGVDRWRVFIPYAGPIKPEEHKAHYEHFNTIFEGHLDPRCKTVSQLWYLPGHPRDAADADFFAVVDGHPFVLPTVAGNLRPAPHGNAGLAGTLHPALAAGAAPSALASRPAPSLQDVTAALSCLDPAEYEDYTRWLDIAMAIFDGTQGSPDGYDIFVAWSLFGEAQKGGRSPGFNNFLGKSPGNIPAAGPDLRQPEPPQDLQHSQQNSPGAAQPVLVTAPEPMPATYRNHPQELSIQKVFDDGETREWKTVVRGFHTVALDVRRTVVEDDYTIELCIRNNSGEHTAVFSGSVLYAPTELAMLLGGRGIVCAPGQMKHLQELLVEWLQKIQEAQRVKRAFTNLGWMVKDGAHMGFAHGDTAYYPDGKHESGIRIAASATGSSNLARHFVPQGSIQPWREVSSFLANQGNQALLAILSTSFASPLMKFSGHSGAVVSIVSCASGVGKSSALVASQSVWGNPTTTVHAATDTILSLASKMGFTRNLPAYWDDIKGTPAMWAQFSDMIYQITLGKERSRLNSNAKSQDVQEWCCLAIVAANDSIFEIMKTYNKGGTDSGVVRVFEITDEDRPKDVKEGTFFDQCKTNYGHAGAIYGKWLAQNRDYAETSVVAMTKLLTDEVGMTSEERFWIAAMSTMLVGAAFAKKLGLVNFDVRALKSYLVKRFYELRAAKASVAVEIGPEDQITSMMFDYSSTTLTINTRPSKNGKTLPTVITPPALKEVELTIIRDDRVLRVRRAKFTEWCQSKGLSADSLHNRLAKLKAIDKVYADPAASEPTYSKRQRAWCYDIDLAKLDLSGDVDGNTV